SQRAPVVGTRTAPGPRPGAPARHPRADFSRADATGPPRRMRPGLAGACTLRCGRPPAGALGTPRGGAAAGTGGGDGLTKLGAVRDRSFTNGSLTAECP